MDASKYSVGDVISCPDYAEYGPGVIARLEDDTADVFFVGGGSRTIDLSTEDVIEEDGASESFKALFAAVTAKSRSRSKRNLYVVRLSADVRQSKKFCARNPALSADAECFYVGITSRSPDVRFDNHKRGYKASPLVRKFGVELAPEYYEFFNPLAYPVAVCLEPAYSEFLREQGYGVWWN